VKKVSKASGIAMFGCNLGCLFVMMFVHYNVPCKRFNFITTFLAKYLFCNFLQFCFAICNFLFDLQFVKKIPYMSTKGKTNETRRTMPKRVKRNTSVHAAQEAGKIIGQAARENGVAAMSIPGSKNRYAVPSCSIPFHKYIIHLSPSRAPVIPAHVQRT
jgi:hypothetical protein